METAWNPRVPFGGCPLGLVSWTEQRSKTHMSDNVMPCEAYHPSGIWQKGEKEHTHALTHNLIWGQGFLDGRSGRWRDSSDTESAPVKVSWFVCVCVFVYMHLFASESLYTWMCICFLFCLCARPLCPTWHPPGHTHTHSCHLSLSLVQMACQSFLFYSVLMIPQYWVSGLAGTICPN